MHWTGPVWIMVARLSYRSLLCCRSLKISVKFPTSLRPIHIVHLIDLANFLAQKANGVLSVTPNITRAKQNQALEFLFPISKSVERLSRNSDWGKKRVYRPLVS